MNERPMLTGRAEKSGKITVYPGTKEPVSIRARKGQTAQQITVALRRKAVRDGLLSPAMAQYILRMPGEA